MWFGETSNKHSPDPIDPSSLQPLRVSASQVKPACPVIDLLLFLPFSFPSFLPPFQVLHLSPPLSFLLHPVLPPHFVMRSDSMLLVVVLMIWLGTLLNLSPSFAHANRQITPSSSSSSSSPRWNPATAYRHLLYSFAAMDSPSQLSSWSCYHCLLHPLTTRGTLISSIIHNNQTDTTVYLAINPTHSEIILSFKGTRDLQQWIQDLKIWTVKQRIEGIEGAEIHAGFNECFRSVADETYKELMKLKEKYPEYEVHVTGHSLGGALATLQAFELEYVHGIHVDQVFTFGCPRVGNAAFAAAYGKYVTGQTWRQTHDHDPVPHLPPTSFQYSHVDRAIEIWERDTVTIVGEYIASDFKVCSMDENEDPDCSASVVGYNPFDHISYWNISARAPEDRLWNRIKTNVLGGGEVGANGKESLIDRLKGVISTVMGRITKTSEGQGENEVSESLTIPPSDETSVKLVRRIHTVVSRLSSLHSPSSSSSSPLSSDEEGPSAEEAEEKEDGEAVDM